MNLPASFIDYTRSLLGDEEYDKLGCCLATGTACQHKVE